MKTNLYLIAVLLVCAYMGGCRNPWMERVLISLYDIGDRGPGGGIIFYRSAKGFTDKYSGKTHHFLEAAPIDQGSFAWATAGSSAEINVSGAVETAIGTGRKNTARILNTTYDPFNDTPAAFLCNDYTGGGKSDWFLPSLDELSQLSSNWTYVSYLQSGDGYWSSSQSILNADRAMIQNINSIQDEIGKSVSFSVRPIRSF